jgi:hypothetical protein
MKKILHENIRVVLEPAVFNFQDDDSIKRDCSKIIEQIKRHVDGVEHASIEWDSQAICSYCENSWEVNVDEADPDWEVGEPVCCTKAQEEWKRTQLMDTDTCVLVNKENQ